MELHAKGLQRVDAPHAPDTARRQLPQATKYNSNAERKNGRAAGSIYRVSHDIHNG